MGYKSITSFVANEAEADETLAAAIRITEAQDGHLNVCALGVDMTPAGGFYMGASPILLQETLTRAQEEAEALDHHLRRLLSRETVRWGTEAVIAQFGTLSPQVGLRARFSDLVVQTQPYGRDALPSREIVIESALFDGQAPVLVVPDTGLRAGFGRHVVVAWNQSNEALNAVRRALPFLKAAEHVTVAMVNPPAQSPERSDPGGLLTQMLARHGVNCEVAVLAKTLPRVSDVLMRFMLDQDAGLLVMGAYGHSRLREAILGGATRNILENADVPVFLAH